MDIRDFQYRDMTPAFDECTADWANRDEKNIPEFSSLPAAFRYRDMASSLTAYACGESEATVWVDPDGDTWVTPDGDGWEAPPE